MRWSARVEGHMVATMGGSGSWERRLNVGFPERSRELFLVPLSRAIDHVDALAGNDEGIIVAWGIRHRWRRAWLNATSSDLLPQPGTLGAS